MLARPRSFRCLAVFLAAATALVSVAAGFHSHPAAGRWPQASSPGGAPGGVASLPSCPVCALVHLPSFPTIHTVGIEEPDFAGFLPVPAEPDRLEPLGHAARSSRAPPAAV